MSEPRTPQVPMVDGNGEPFYPLTQYNQIVMPDGNRWDGKGGGAQIDDTSASTEKVYSSQKVEAIASQLSEQIENVGTQNLLVNSNFQAPYLINLNGKTEYVEAGETVSGWLSDSLQLAVSVNDDGIVLTNKKTSGTRTKLESVVRGVVPGETYTLAVKTESELCVTAATLLNNATSSDVEYAVGYMLSGGYFCVTAKANNSGFTVSFRTSNNTSTHKIKWAALVPGTYTAETLPTPIWLHPRLEMIRMGLPVSPVNLLDNSDFTNPVNQRGLTTYATTGSDRYTIDRWIALKNTAVYVLGDRIEIAPQASSGRGVRQIVNNAARYAGKTLTAAVKIKNLSNRSGLYLNDGTETGISITAPGIYVVTKVIADDVSSLVVQISANGTTDADRIGVEWIVLYEGAYTLETLPPYRPKENELAACKRRFHRIGKAKTTDALVFSGYVTSSGKEIIVAIDGIEDMSNVDPTNSKPTVSCSGKIVIRGAAGYCEDATATSPMSGAIITARYTDDGVGALLIKKSDGSAFAGITNNTVVAVTFTEGSYIDISNDL